MVSSGGRRGSGLSLIPAARFVTAGADVLSDEMGVRKKVEVEAEALQCLAVIKKYSRMSASESLMLVHDS